MKYATVKSDDAEEVVFSQVIQDVDQRNAGLDGKMVPRIILFKKEALS